MCECHQMIKQCQPANENTQENATKECGFALAKHESVHLLQWVQNILNGIMECSPFPTMGRMEEVDPHGV